MNADDVFWGALAKSSPAERAAYLDQACGDDAALRSRVEALLQSHESAGSFLGKPVIQVAAEKLADKPLDDATAVEHRRTTGLDETSLGFLEPAQRADSLGRLGYYEVLEVIGHGAMGIVLRAFDEKLQRVVAIKVMAPGLATTSPPRKRFLREARAAAAVQHEHVVVIHAVEERPIPYLVMEYISGETLQQRMDRVGPLDVKEVLRIGRQIASGLAAAHQRGLIHRDVKPSNILIEKGVQERVKITDFGLARAVADASLTQSGVIAGTPMYMAPEQAGGDSMDHRADLFSLGSVLYAMCSGRPPFRATTSMATLRRVIEGEPRPIREFMPEVPQWLCDIIANLHAKKPEDRCPSAQELADLLGRCLTSLEQGKPIVLEHEARPLEESDGVKTCSAAAIQPRFQGGFRLGRRSAAIAAGIVLLMLGTLSFSEATGLTQWASTAIRIVTGEGTLVIEVADPNVEVSLDGEELSITGAGLKEIKLRPGQYQLRAIKGGQAVKQELVNVTRGGRQIVRITCEPVDKALPSQEAEKRVEFPGAFVVLGADGAEIGKFDSLAKAVEGGARDGDTIEIRGNGPYATNRLTVDKPLTIRAGAGFQPVLRQVTPSAEGPLLFAGAALVLEGLTLESEPGWFLGTREHGPTALLMANCRLRTSTVPAELIWHRALHTQIRNCDLIGGTIAVDWNCRTGGSHLIENSVLAAAFGISYGNCAATDVDLHDVSVTFRRNTVTGPAHAGLAIAFGAIPTVAEGDSSIALDVERNVFAGGGCVVHAVHFVPQDCGETTRDMVAALNRLVAWHARQNLCVSQAQFLNMQLENTIQVPPPPPDQQFRRVFDLKAAGAGEIGQTFWGLTEAGVDRGDIRFAGGELRARNVTNRLRLPLGDFRLRPDSAGYQAGPDGKDLGADVDLVGPGAAYERWKELPEYATWLEEVARLMSTNGTAPAGGSETVAPSETEKGATPDEN
ncbi:MAG: serine/threonine protein kinase [Pirellulales bacterium]|nr:serine/threonine protein kinase [Pirellulales bacterium]